MKRGAQVLAGLLLLIVSNVYSMEVLYNSYGPRPLSMGGAYIAVGGDPEAVFWNPGGIPTVSSAMIATGYQNRVGDIQFAEFFSAFNVPKSIVPFGGSLGLGFVYWGTTEEGWNEINESIGNIFANEFIVALGYKKEFAGILSIGATLKYARSDIAGASDNAFVLDIGGLSTISGVGIGLMVKNIGFGSGTVEIPIGMSLGASYTFLKSRDNNHFLSGSIELDSVQGTGFTLKFGSEYAWWYAWDGNLRVRLGYDTTPSKDLAFYSGLSAGLGFSYFGITINYTFLSYGILGINHEVSLSYNIDNAMTRRSINQDGMVPTVSVSLPSNSVVVTGDSGYNEILVKYRVEDNVGIDRVTISVQDSSGRPVASSTVPNLRGLREFEQIYAWNGKDSSGEPVLDDVYRVVVSAQDMNYNEGKSDIGGLIVTSDLYSVVLVANPNRVTMLGDVVKIGLVKPLATGLRQWRVTIRDANGTEVRRFQKKAETSMGPDGVPVTAPLGFDTLIWDLSDNSGNRLDSGDYQVFMEVEYDNGIKRSSFPITVHIQYAR